MIRQVLLASLLLFAHLAMAEETVITSCDHNGAIAWSNAAVEGTATIEWAPSVFGPWHGNWETITDIPVTGSTMSAQVPMFFRVVQRKYAPVTNNFATVAYDPADKAFYIANSNTYPSGYGTYQKNGPEYAFYVSQYEVSNAEFCRFLNDAEANSSNSRGNNMFVDTNSGTVYMDSSKTVGAEELFEPSNSRLAYDVALPVGGRYSVVTNTPQGGGSFSNHPVVGVSWYGAVKYCNWLTIDQGRGESQRCYSEGINPPDWAPVTASSWDLDVFTDAERSVLLAYRGFRMFMDHTSTVARAYNEFYKAAAWNGATNTVYGFGRDVLGSRDANYAGSGDPYEDAVLGPWQSTPVGYYDGSDHGGTFLTRQNDNYYGIYDLSGNVSEWIGDRGGLPAYSPQRGGSWGNDIGAQLGCNVRGPFFRHKCSNSNGFPVFGFRVITTQP